MLHAPPSHPPSPDPSNNIWWSVHNFKLLITQSSVISPILGLEYLPQALRFFCTDVLLNNTGEKEGSRPMYQLVKQARWNSMGNDSFHAFVPYLLSSFPLPLSLIPFLPSLYPLCTPISFPSFSCFSFPSLSTLKNYEKYHPCNVLRYFNIFVTHIKITTKSYLTVSAFIK